MRMILLLILLAFEAQLGHMRNSQNRKSQVSATQNRINKLNNCALYIHAPHI